MARAREFVRNLNRRIENFKQNSVALGNRYALAIDRQLLLTTPVDTSTAISNWMVTLGRPHTGYEEPYVRGSHGSTQGASIREAYDQAETALSDRRYGQIIYISNGAPYIARLNDGWSAQAPAGFIEQAIATGRNSVRTTGFSLFERFSARTSIRTRF